MNSKRGYESGKAFKKALEAMTSEGPDAVQVRRKKSEIYDREMAYLEYSISTLRSLLWTQVQATEQNLTRRMAMTPEELERGWGYYTRFECSL